MKRWKITGPKQEPVTCENCEEGREFVCVFRLRSEKYIRFRQGAKVFTSDNGCTGDAADYKFLRYLDPDPELQPRQVRFSDLADCAVYTVAGECHTLRWNVGKSFWGYDTESGRVQWCLSWTGPHTEPVTLTGQTAELVEEE